MTKAPVPADLASALASRYDVRDVLGRGGMATVYVAYDRKHQREVALKVLRPEISMTIGASRFLSEIQIVARMVHPHILPLHDSGETDGFVYYVMPFIDGGSLRDALVREERMSSARAVDLAAPIADALTYAHSLGVLHRDIKPENVLFASTHPIVADFGIAKAVSSATSGAQLTRTGISLGTPGYMSPEQAAGFGDVDARTDVYSLAVLVYEMITGEVPGRWVTEESTRTARFTDCAASHRPLLSAAGAGVEAALVRALALRSEQRTATPAEFIADLRGEAKVRRKYHSDDVQAIVSRAAEMEASNPTMSGAMTMGGMEQVARDAGIDPRFVRAAAADLSPRKSSSVSGLIQPKTNWIIGGPTRLLFEREIEGEIAEADYPVLVEEIRRMLGEVGVVSQLGRSFTWSLNRGSSGITMIEIGVAIRNGRTRIMAQENLGQLIGAIFGGLGGGLGGGGLGPVMGVALGTTPLLVPAAGFFIVPAWLGIVYSIARFTYSRSVKARATKLGNLTDRLAALCVELLEEAAPALPTRDDPRLLK
ncbi:MAG: serine/threonine-protein kinase [Gemmatimonadota bacterium]